MSEKASILKDYAEYIYGTIDKAVEGLTEKEMMWKPTEQSNNIEWILNHLARLSNISLPRIISGDQNYMPKGWPQDYKDQHPKMDKMITDIQSGKKAVLDGIGKLTNTKLEEEIPLWGGKQKRKTGLFAYLGELIHHKGQIAYIRGTFKRLKEKDPRFLA